ncbi:MAG: hypothetical protein AAGF67_12375, partial [Verrucomicrobiota bacterium]
KGRDKALFGVENRNISIFEDTFAQLPLAGMHSFGEFGAASPNLFLRNHSVSGALFYSAEEKESS